MLLKVLRCYTINALIYKFEDGFTQCLIIKELLIQLKYHIYIYIYVRQRKQIRVWRLRNTKHYKIILKEIKGQVNIDY